MADIDGALLPGKADFTARRILAGNYKSLCSEIIGAENLFDWDEAGMAPRDVAQIVLDHEGERMCLDEQVRVFESSDAMENVRLVVSELFQNGFYTVEVVPGNIEFNRE